MVARQLLRQEPPIQWLAGSPLWAQLAVAGESFRRPAILRFTNDTFMEDFLAIATTDADRLSEWRVQKETWRKPAPTPRLNPAGAALLPGAATGDPELDDQPLKLYQPAHQRYYLVVASLVCRLPGLPDKRLNLSQDERVSFVLRRDMKDRADQQVKEHALLEGGWQPLAPGQEQQLLAGEQQFPMFPVTCRRLDGQQRRLFAGLVPVSGREAYMTTGRRPAAGAADPADPTAERAKQLLTVLEIDVLEPWREINRLRLREDTNIDKSLKDIKGDVDKIKELGKSIEIARDKLQTMSWYVLLDLACYLRNYLGDVWKKIEANPTGSISPGTAGEKLIKALQQAVFLPQKIDDTTVLTDVVLKNLLQGSAETDGQLSMAQALKEVLVAETDLESATTEYWQGQAGWPESKFLLCGRYVESVAVNLRGLVSDAFDAAPPTAQRIPLLPLAQQISEAGDASDYDQDLFVIRCVFARPNCPPSVRPAVVSEASVPFQMASYFDPDAPARPIRIPMPVDTTPAGLRKFARNTMFVLSDTLACQISKARAGLTLGDLVLSVLPWPFHKDLPDPQVPGCEDGKLDSGLLCTLSIPIITICALILLIIIVFVLDIIFKWVPLLIFCLPLPGIKAKGR